MLWNLVVFALVGLLAGGAARLFYPDRQPRWILGALLQGVIGGLLGGLLSWAIWPETDGQVASGALLLSLLGAVVVLVFWTVLTYARNLAAPPDVGP